MSDKDGIADFRGFYGDYDITAEIGGVKKTFRYSLVKDGENRIDITFDGSDIAAAVSAQPKGDVSPVTYSSVEEAGKELRENEGFNYDGVVLEAGLKGAAAQSTVMDGGITEENTDYTNGEAWASNAGIKDNATDSADGIIMMAKQYTDIDLRHRIKGNILGGNVEISCTIDTYDSRSDFKSELIVDSAEEYQIGNIICDDSGYYLQCMDEEKLSLDDNSRYELKVTLCSGDRGSQSLKYELFKNNTAQKSAECSVNSDISVKEIRGMAFKMSSASNGGENVLRIVNARIKFMLDEPIISFKALDYEHKALDESMKNFDFEKTAALSDYSYLNGEAWGTDGNNIQNGFEYKTYQKYLWAIRGSDKNIHSLRHEFAAPDKDEVLTVEFDTSLYALNWYDGNGKAGVNLCSTDGTQIPVICVSYNQYGYKGSLGSGYNVGFVLRMLNSDGNETENILPVYSGEKNALNRNNLHVKLTLTENDSGGRDAKLVMTGSDGSVYTAEKEQLVPASAAKGLDTIELYSQTESLSAGKNIGSTVLGVKNIVICKNGHSAAQKENDKYKFAPGAAVGVDYTNTTQRPFDAAVIVSGYTDDTLTESYIKEFSESGAAGGSLSVRLPQGGADYYKIFVLDGFKNLKPYKDSDVILIK